MSVCLIQTTSDLQGSQGNLVKWEHQVRSAFQDSKVTKGSQGCKEVLVLRVSLVSPVLQDPRAPLVTRESCKGLGNKERMVLKDNQDLKDSRGQMDCQEDQVPKVSWDQRETRDLRGRKVTGAHLEKQVPEDSRDRQALQDLLV